MEPTDFKNVIVDQFLVLSKTKATKMILWKVIQTRWFWNFGLVTSKMTSKHQQPPKLPSGFHFNLHFWNQWLPLIKMNYRLPYSENFHFSNLLAASEAGGRIIWKMKVFRIRQSIAHFDQWKPLISKMPSKLKSNGRPLRLLRFRGCFRGHRGQNFKII